jgi:hypothetical protein
MFCRYGAVLGLVILYQKTSVTAIPCIEEENQVSGLGALSFRVHLAFDLDGGIGVFFSSQPNGVLSGKTLLSPVYF